MNDKIPEITEEFTLTVVRADGTRSEKSYKDSIEQLDQRTLDALLNGDWDEKIGPLAKEILNHGRKRQDQA